MANRKHSRGIEADEDDDAVSSSSNAIELGKRRREQYVLDVMKSRQSVPSGTSPKKWLSEPDKLKWASKRGMVKKIANKANPASKDNSSAFTIGGKRYALTDLYRSPITEKARDAGARTKAKSLDWWDAHKKQVVIGAVAATAAYLLYTKWKNTQLQNQLAARRPLRPLLPAPHKASGEYAMGEYAGWQMQFTDPYGNYDTRSPAAWDGFYSYYPGWY
jgi:hypothetical protein